MAVLAGEVIVHRHDDGRVEIVQAPPTASMSLEMLASADPVTVRVGGNLVTLGGQVVYRVVGWDRLQHALVLELVEDRRGA